MASIAQLGRFAAAQTIIDAAATATVAPSGDADSISTSGHTSLLVLVSYTGDPTAGSLTVWIGEAGSWYELSSVALSPPSASAHRVDVPAGSEIHVQLDAVTFTTSGTVTVLARKG